jgi:enoyl-CoA hydratase/carnithine racemase
MQAQKQETLVRIEMAGAVAIITLVNPPVNTLRNALLEQLLAAAQALAENGDARAVVLTGTGPKAFASGADVAEFQEMLGSDEAVAHHTSLTRRTFDTIAGLPQPVVAALQASAVGGGLELALATDLIVADAHARLGLPEVGLGLIPGAGGTQRLPRRIGLPQAVELILLGRLLTAVEAQEIGLVMRVAPAGEALSYGLELAEQLAAQPAVAVRAAKRALRVGSTMSLEEGLDVEREQFTAALSSVDAREGLTAFLERRRPDFGHR